MPDDRQLRELNQNIKNLVTEFSGIKNILQEISTSLKFLRPNDILEVEEKVSIEQVLKDTQRLCSTTESGTMSASSGINRDCL